MRGEERGEEAERGEERGEEAERGEEEKEGREAEAEEEEREEEGRSGEDDSGHVRAEQVLVCGSPNLDFKALEAAATYAGGYSANSQAVEWFWQ
eukprot:446176-Hanusia_phi.AAC.1